MNSSIEVSVIVPFLNEEVYIERCIDSLQAQDIDQTMVELIFVDNNSTDASVAMVSRYNEVKLVYEQKHHVYAARNTAIKNASGKVLAFTDADCVVSTNWISSILDEFRSGTVDIVLGERNFGDDASFMSQFMRDYENLKIQFFLKGKDYKRCFGYTNNMAVSRRVYDDLGGFREDIPLADTDFILRYIRESEQPKIGYSSGASIRHLEIGTWSAWIRKLSLYGKQSPQSEIPLYVSWRKQIKLYMYCLRSCDYSPVKKALFFLTVICANTAYLVPYFLNGGAKLMVRDVSG